MDTLQFIHNTGTWRLLFLGVNSAGSGEDPPKTVQDSLDGLTENTVEAGKNQFLEIPWNES